MKQFGSCGVAALKPVAFLSALLSALWIPGGFPGLLLGADTPSSVDFQRDVRPILAGHCFKCHGPDPDARKAGLRLDRRGSATQPGKSDVTPIVPGNPEESELVRRIFAEDADDRMPPAETKNPLSESQKEILREWIVQGAEYTRHWAFIPPKQKPLPQVKRRDWPNNPIDHFVLARLEKAGLAPSPRADRHTLVRRLYLDLIGLPPTPKEIDRFLRDESPDAYEKLVDRLLASPHYGERWGRRWLDLARYADTNGYEKDRPRSIWPYRDWVINALNDDMPFDRFTIEQLAGDMLPNPTVDQRVATGFHRNTMLNEEGGIDPLEYRFYAMVDRVNTTATTWLGMTLACAQCHTHKYDPIPQKEYYQFMAFLNNADEPTLHVPRQDLKARRQDLQNRIDSLKSEFPERFPVPQTQWHPVSNGYLQSAAGAAVNPREDRTFQIKPEAPESDTYTLRFQSPLQNITALRLKVLPDRTSKNISWGRGSEGQALLSEINVTVAPAGKPSESQRLEITQANTEADSKTKKHPAAQAIDGDPETGWLIEGRDESAPRSVTFNLAKPTGFENGTQWTIELEQQAGIHRLGFQLGTPIQDPRPMPVRRQEQLDQHFQAWLKAQQHRVVRWQPLRPEKATSNLPLLTVQEDDSVLASGDQTKRDVYRLQFDAGLDRITAVRLEALPDPRLPRHGPGRVYYEGPKGDFFLSEFTLSAGDRSIPISHASQSYAGGGATAARAIDGDPQTGWSINGGQGRAHTAVFNLAEPLTDGAELDLKLVFERYHAAGLGRFRISVTTDPSPVEALELPIDIQQLLLIPQEQLSQDQHQRLRDYYLSVTPKLADEHRKIEQLRKQMPEFPTTLVMDERPENNPRPTYLHKRGEFLQPTEQVDPGVLSVLHEFPRDKPKNRLEFARWLVDPDNPLVGRVVMNRHWAAFFGTGLVKTIQDFGTQGDLPSHPDLLDWLAVEFVKRDWSLKAMHRLIVTSATYRQSSRTTPELQEKDPQNRLLARGPRFRLEAELIRDLALRAAGLLANELGGPSVFPPQPAGVTTEGTYGPLQWKTSQGADRYRRGLYTFSKRTAPYAMFSTFDAPSGEKCIARRERSNTPLQALTTLNDTVFMEAARALGKMVARREGPVKERIVYLFRRCLSRSPDPTELGLLLRFYHKQKDRLEAGELNAQKIAGSEREKPVEQAAWTTLARSVLNLDETITKH